MKMSFVMCADLPILKKETKWFFVIAVTFVSIRLVTALREYPRDSGSVAPALCLKSPNASCVRIREAR